MDQTILMSALLGGLLGSLITIIAARLTAFALRRQEHTMSLQRAFFEKKLQAAEHALAQWHATTSLLSGLVLLYERITSKERELEYELFRVTNDALVTQWKNISQSTHDVANVVLLYFDTDDSSFINSDVIKNLLSRLSSIRSLDISLKFALDMYEKVRGSRQEDAVWGEAERIMEEYRSNLKDISAIFGQAQQEMVDFLGKIRKEMRKYETS